MPVCAAVDVPIRQNQKDINIHKNMHRNININ